MSDMVAYVAIKAETLEKLIEGARTTSYEYLRQASNYAKLNQPAVERETYENHYAPLRDAIREAENARRESQYESLIDSALDDYRSRVEVLPGTVQASSAPHPPKEHLDEIELMDEDTWEQSRNLRRSCPHTPEWVTRFGVFSCPQCS